MGDLKPIRRQFSPVEHRLTCPTCGEEFTRILPASMEPSETDCDKCSAEKNRPEPMTEQEHEALVWDLALSRMRLPPKLLAVPRRSLERRDTWQGDPWCVTFAG